MHQKIAREMNLSETAFIRKLHPTDNFTQSKYAFFFKARMVPEARFPVGEWHLREMLINYLHADRRRAGEILIWFSVHLGEQVLGDLNISAPGQHWGA